MIRPICKLCDLLINIGNYKNYSHYIQPELLLCLRVYVGTWLMLTSPTSGASISSGEQDVQALLAITCFRLKIGQARGFLQHGLMGVTLPLASGSDEQGPVSAPVAKQRFLSSERGVCTNKSSFHSQKLDLKAPLQVNPGAPGSRCLYFSSAVHNARPQFQRGLETIPEVMCPVSVVR
jgi:hypothetical protein